MLDKQKNQGILKPYLRNVNVRWGKFDLSDMLQMPFEDDEDERYSICQNDLVVCEGGEPGRCAIWTASDPIKFQKALHRIRVKDGILNKYIQIILKTFCTNGMIEGYYTGSTIKHLTGDSLNSILFPLPPTKEQLRIVDEVETWESVMDILMKEGVELSSAILQVKSRILDLAIHGKLVPQDPNDEPAIELLKRINPSFVPCDNAQYPNIPTNWVTCTVKDVFQINPKTNASDNLDAGFVSMSNICDQYNNAFTFETRTWSDIKRGYTHFKDGDIAVAKISPCLENRKSVVFHDLPNGIGSGTTELNVFRSDIVYPLFGLYFFKSQHFISNCVGTFNGVVGQQRVATKIVEEIDYFLPPYQEQIRIVGKIKKLFAVLDEIHESIEA